MNEEHQNEPLKIIDREYIEYGLEKIIGSPSHKDWYIELVDYIEELAQVMYVRGMSDFWDDTQKLAWKVYAKRVLEVSEHETKK